MTYAYVRYSTDSQDDMQQMQALTEYAEKQGITIDAIERDEGISGGVSYKDRNLNKLVKKLRRGDTLITSEISRLGRSISDLNILVNEELKPRGVRLIVTKMGIDLDCSNMRAMDQMIIFAFSFAAEIEKEMIQQRTQSALDARKKLIKEDGGFVSKAGNFRTHLGNKKGCDTTEARMASIASKRSARDEWRKTGLFPWVELQVLRGRARKDIIAEAQEMYEKDPERWCTRQGRPLSEAILSRWIKDILPVI
jgi:DNA invertase Pin-like site-specific DNA recombinase